MFSLEVINAMNEKACGKAEEKIYKSIDELTEDQFEELKEQFINMITDFSEKEWDNFIKEYYAGISFTDDDFFCTAGM